MNLQFFKIPKIKAQTIFATMFYGSWCWLTINGKPIPQALSHIVFMLLSFHYGSKHVKKQIKDNL